MQVDGEFVDEMTALVKQEHSVSIFIPLIFFEDVIFCAIYIFSAYIFQPHLIALTKKSLKISFLNLRRAFQILFLSNFFSEPGRCRGL